MLEIRCLEDLDELGEEITDPLEALEQDNYHRLITPPGGNIDDPNFGLGLDRKLSGSDMEIAALPAEISAELRKDDRNALVRVTMTKVDRGRYRFDIAIQTDTGRLLEMGVFAGRNGVELV